jgi:hypothetical protein
MISFYTLILCCTRYAYDARLFDCVCYYADVTLTSAQMHTGSALEEHCVYHVCIHFGMIVFCCSAAGAVLLLLYHTAAAITASSHSGCCLLVLP